MPLTLQTNAFNYKNDNGTFQTIDCIKGEDCILTPQDKLDIAQQVGEVLDYDVTYMYQRAATVQDVLDEENVDLDLTDSNGNVLVRMQNGYIKTKNADTSLMPVSTLTYNVSENVDLDIIDTNGNIIARIQNGHIKTKNADTANMPISIPVSGSPNDTDLDIIDANGNVILRVQNGYLKTKKVDTTDPFELPEYYNSYLIRKCNEINRLKRISGGDAFFFCTDQHTWGNTMQSHKLIHYIAKQCRINKLFMGGDLDNGVMDRNAKLYKDAIGGRAYFMGGNHDYMSNATEAEIAASLTSDYDDMVMGDPLRLYYWVDNPKHKIRYIVTNSFKPNGNGTWDWGFESAQVTWLINEAMNLQNGWKCIIFSHMFWRNVNETTTDLMLPDNMKAVLDAIDAANTDGRVLAIIQGHTHLDATKVTDGGIPILITTCDKWAIGTPGHEPQLANRIPGTVTEQAFDVCIVDQTNNKLYAVRIGGFNTGDFNNDDNLFNIGRRTLDI